MSKNSLHCRFDHLVVCAHTCAQGVSWIDELCGVMLPAGGNHPLMATHNHLSALSDNSFIEVIACDPAAAEPDRARWFALDDAQHQARLAKKPMLTTWVVATDNLDLALQEAQRSGIDAGVPVELTRGNLNWRIGLRDDGSLACDGVFPILIEWPEQINPVRQMKDQGIRLDKLSLKHPKPEFLHNALSALNAADLVTINAGPAALSAQLHVANKTFQFDYLQ
ncbi:MAG: VOC family protein [Granulosicoccus sp.]